MLGCTDGALHFIAKPSSGKGELTDGIVYTARGHIHGNKEREASDPSRASKAVCSFPCLFALSNLNA